MRQEEKAVGAVTRIASVLSASMGLLLVLFGVLIPIWRFELPRIEVFPVVFALGCFWAALSMVGRQTNPNRILVRLTLVLALGLWLWLMEGVTL